MKKPQLFALHFSGGSAYSFRSLLASLDVDFEVHPLELPGRGRRLDEELIYSYEEACTDLLHQLRGRRNGAPYIVYGHSLGAELGFAVVRAMEVAGDAPLHFFPTGNAGPNIHQREKTEYMSRSEFFDFLKSIGGITDEMLTNEELMDFMEPILRADFLVLQNSEEVQVNYKIRTPVKALMGTKEKYAPQIANWEGYTLGGASCGLLEGDHFFINRHEEAIRQGVRDCFAQKG